MSCKVFYGKCPDPDYPNHWLLFSVNLPSPVPVSKCGYHGGQVVIEGRLKEGWVDSADSDKGYTDREPRPRPES